MCRWQPVEGRRALAYLRAKHGVEALPASWFDKLTMTAPPFSDFVRFYFLSVVLFNTLGLFKMFVRTQILE
jgi:hypothetical protein